MPEAGAAPGGQTAKLGRRPPADNADVWSAGKDGPLAARGASPTVWI